MEEMDKILPLPSSGLYHLVISLTQIRWLEVGALGLKRFPPGTYIYTGSAKRALKKRLARHVQRVKKCYWHIDFLTTVASVDEVLIDTTWKYSECGRHRKITALPGAEVIIPRFGASDCRCNAHLSYFETRPNLRRLRGLEACLKTELSL